MINKLNQKHKNWLINRGILPEILDKFEIYSAYNRIVIPIKDLNGIILFNKYRRDPEEIEGAKYTYDFGATVKLFNIEILSKIKKVIICEGELDVLLLKSKGFEAVTSTGGATSFQKDWIPFFNDLDIYICLDNDKAGRLGTIKICQIIPQAKPIPLPQGEGIKDVTNYFQKHSVEEFKILMKVATPLDIPPEPKPIKRKAPKEGDSISRAKAVPITNFLHFNGANFAHCPFHTDKTPSLKKYNKGSWHCFSCGEGRDTIDFIMKRDELNFHEAIEYLLK